MAATFVDKRHEALVQGEVTDAVSTSPPSLAPRTLAEAMPHSPQVTALRALSDGLNTSPHSVGQRALAEAMSLSPQVTALRALSAGSHGPRAVAQRQNRGSLGGDAVHLAAGPEGAGLLSGGFGPMHAPIQRIVNVGGHEYVELQMVPGTTYRLVRRNWKPWARRFLYHTGNHTLLPTQFTDHESQELMAVFTNLGLRGVVSLDEMIEGLDHARALGIEPRVTLARLALIHDTIRDVVLVRIQADHAHVAGMYPAGTLDPVFANAFQSIEIPGSDPHKGGQVVVFINYLTLAHNPLRVVYKPGDLRIDRLLFGDQPGSVAQTLAGGLASYSMVTRVDAAAPDARQRHYGYLSFVNSGAPATAADVTSVYNSVGENLALAYVFGLRDIHKDNFILLTNRVQLIDMEAATGTFTGFGSMELLSLPNKLVERIVDGLLGVTNAALAGWLPTTAALRTAVRTGFTNQLAAMDPHAAHDAVIGAGIAAMSNLPARFVPFPTNELQLLAGQYLGRLAAPTPATTAQFDASTQALAAQTALAAPGASVAHLRTLLRAPATRVALNRGDVPFWTRVGDAVFEEDGGLPIVPAMAHPRLSSSANIAAAANARRGAINGAAALLALTTDAIPLFGDINGSIVARHQFKRALAGHGPPNH